MRQVNIIDAPCGYGKTSWAIQAMNEACAKTHKFIYVTPFLNEVERVKESVKNRTFYTPSIDQAGETKLNDLHRLLKEGKDICTTHSLFQMANKETRKLLKAWNYTLILDEVLNVIQQVKLKKNDLDLLFRAKSIFVEENQRGIKFIRWNEELRDWDTQYDKERNMALSGNVMYSNKGALIWNFPCDIFSLFHDVYILTYLFGGQIQRYYYDLHDIQYKYLSVINDGGEYSLVPYNNRNIHDKILLNSLINIYQGNLNDVGNKSNALSSTWLKKGQNTNQLKKDAYNYLTNKLKATNKDALWTTYKDSRQKVQPRNFATSFLTVNARATNEYKDKFNLAYLVNRYMSPIEISFFEQYGVKVDEETWALSELIQWVWRSRIRDGLPINIYIPSRRMRLLFMKYLSSDIFETPPSKAITSQYPSDWFL